MATTSWKPASLLDVQGKDPNYTYRWVSKSKIDSGKATAEGWEVVKTSTTGPKAPAKDSTKDGSPLDTTVQRREMILCRMPLEMKEARAKYYQDRAAENAIRSADETRRLGNSYGKGIENEGG